MSVGLVALLSVLAVFAAAHVALLGRDLIRRARAGQRLTPSGYELAVGAITDFFDTLGIGSFATTTALFRARSTVPVERLPGTLNVGHAAPTFVQAFVYVVVLEVDLLTLAALVAASVLGAVLGADRVARWPRARVQRGLGLAMLVAAALLLSSAVGVGPVGGAAIGLEGAALAVATLLSFFFGALMMIGVGAYAPILVTVSLLGMNPRAAFPIMMTACALLMPAASARFVANDAYAPRAALGLTLGGIPAVLVAAFVVREVSLDMVRWLVLAVVLSTSFVLLRDASQHPNDEP